MDDEIVALKTNQIWDLVPRPEFGLVIGSKWVFSIKIKSDGTLWVLKDIKFILLLNVSIVSIMRRIGYMVYKIFFFHLSRYIDFFNQFLFFIFFQINWKKNQIISLVCCVDLAIRNLEEKTDWISKFGSWRYYHLRINAQNWLTVFDLIH